jgi:hypothetical protein
MDIPRMNAGCHCRPAGRARQSVLTGRGIGTNRNCGLRPASENRISGFERRKLMSIERGVAAFAGFMVLLSVVLTQFVHPGFVWLTVFVGANLFQQAFTGICPAAWVMRRAGLRSEGELARAAR